jgi:hypothetical protein
MKAEADPDFGLGRGDLNIFFNIFYFFFENIHNYKGICKKNSGEWWQLHMNPPLVEGSLDVIPLVM